MPASLPARLLLAIFLIWAAVGTLAIGLHLDEAWIDSLAQPEPVRAFLKACLGWGDFIFIVLGTLNIYLAATLRLGLTRTRLCALIILPASALLEGVGTITGIPFGAYTYTDNFGPRLFGILPCAIPLAWFIIVVGAGLIFTQYFPLASHSRIALFVALFAVAFDFILEPFAYGVRHYWHWEIGGVPLANYLTWFAASFLFARVTPLIAPPRVRPDPRPALVLAAMLILFVTGRISYGI
ncbi:MAG: carotenoid biosynthesis protein [Verrucomicrobiia bacterium]